MADLGLAQLHDMKTNAEMIANIDPYGPPLIADMDTGYGGMCRQAFLFLPLFLAFDLFPHTFLIAKSFRSSDGLQGCTTIYSSRSGWIPY